MSARRPSRWLPFCGTQVKAFERLAVTYVEQAVSQSRKGPNSGLADLLASEFFVLMRVGRGKHERGFFPCRHTQGQNHPIRWVLIPSAACV